jgi:hypothetical protein
MLGLEFGSAEELLDWTKIEFQRIPRGVREGFLESWIIPVHRMSRRLFS